ncbi:hypothetical protein T492DRAFT_1003740 [Pavlovales sp. CCMP2436]|nr:hypothetical protein T492DRAFT_1003740 [Pavlovales sp. CCMP2436]|mmetsp:Transcript_38826/g.95999  ORF Transcript_38826/g.95999 Transcript_38826/m.95999 type:complete len:315 (-) Transcript_38826:48-992(-)
MATAAVAVLCTLALHPARLEPRIFRSVLLAARPLDCRAPPTMTLVDTRGLALAAVIPSALGLWKREYTVSYGYGGAMLASGCLSLANGAASASPIALAHALLYVCYGARLVLFLLYRELNIPYFNKVRDRIEERAPEGSRYKRLPFCLSCAFLYFCMAAPLKLTESVGVGAAGSSVKLLLAIAYGGFLVASIGDLQKSVAKARGVGLVTSGLFARLRHPNYTGEAALWLASALAGIAAAASMLSLSTAAWALASAIGCAGIQFVLAQATTGLERRQREKYAMLRSRTSNADSVEYEYAYEAWLHRSWAGLTLKS